MKRSVQSQHLSAEYDRMLERKQQIEARERAVVEAPLREEVESLRAAIATAQAERDAALQRAEKFRASMYEIEESCSRQRKRAEQAESALAQAQAERAPLVALLQECRQRVGDWIVGVGAMESNEDGFDLMHRIEAAVAQPPALPPLPNDVQAVLREADVLLSIAAHYGSAQWLEDVVTLRQKIKAVLRHAERAHQQLKEGK